MHAQLLTYPYVEMVWVVSFSLYIYICTYGCIGAKSQSNLESLDSVYTCLLLHCVNLYTQETAANHPTVEHLLG